MVSKHSIYLLLVMTLVAATACKRPAPADRETGIIPLPVSLEMGTGSFRMGDGTKLISSTPGSGLDKIAEMFRDEIASLGGPELETGSGRPRKNSIALELSDEAFASPEGYHLSVKPSGILITASAPQGIFYGLKSLEQMILVRDAEENGMRLPCLEIEDYPRYSWRGMHLDVSRHFFTVDSVKRYIDFMALYKYNRFHWHLTDDQGWRIEIREYPDLTRTGAWRVPAEEGSAATVTPSTGGLYGGFYTQAEIREVVQYAADRFIEVVPEIEMPGHSQAAIAAYPELGVTGKRLEVKRHWGISPNIFNPFEGTFVFLENVLTEVMDLFPYGYIHIGGDEAIKDQWEASAKVQAFIASHGLADEDELQSWFLKKIDTFLVANGRKLIGWDEILDGGLPPEATVMSWRGMQGGIEAVGLGHDVIMTPNTHCYFNFAQAENEPTSWAKRHVTKLGKVYGFELTPPEPDDAASPELVEAGSGLSAEAAAHILGGQGCVWTEHIENFRQVERKLFPRVTALSEVLWSAPGGRDYEGYLLRLNRQRVLFDRMDVDYFKGDWMDQGTGFGGGTDSEAGTE